MALLDRITVQRRTSGLSAVLALLCCVASVTGCSRDRDEAPRRAETAERPKAEARAPTPPPPEFIPVSSADARYRLVSVDSAGAITVVVTERRADDGSSFARRELRCADGTFRFTDEAANLAALDERSGDGDFIEVSTGSTSDAILRYVCSTKG
jgi:hypothetical protein